MDTLKPNMYVRTKYGIAKIIQTNFKDENEEDVLVVDKELEFGYVGCNDERLCNINDILKASYNIIDLIEVGDYVNGIKVNDVYSPDGKNVFRIELEVNGLRGHIISKSEDIKSIVTKEQFSQMEYKVGGVE